MAGDSSAEKMMGTVLQKAGILLSYPKKCPPKFTEEVSP
jgi:hypothetical protein